jgi:hypothetical protein
MGGNGVRLAPGWLVSLTTSGRLATNRPSSTPGPTTVVSLRVPATAAWCRTAVLSTIDPGNAWAKADRRIVPFELARLGGKVRGTKLVEAHADRVDARLVSGSLPWFEETFELLPAGLDATEIRWSVHADMSDTIAGAARVRLALRWLARDAGSRLENVRLAAARRLVERTMPVVRARVSV